MLRQKLVTFVLYLLMLTLGAAGIVAAFNGGPLGSLATTDATAQQDAPAIAQPGVEDALDYDWHEFGPFRTLRATDDQEIIVDRLHVYFKSEDDVFRGRITALNGTMGEKGMDDQPLNVQFIRNNAVVAATTLNIDGTFEISGLAPGPYDLRVLSQRSLLVSSFVLSTREDLLAAGYTDEQIDRVFLTERQRPFQLEAAGCIPDDYELVVELLNETYEFSKQAVPPAKFPQWTRLHIPQVTNFDAAEGGTSYLRHIVRLDREGVLYGQLRKPVDLPTGQVGVKQIGNIEIFFLQNKQVVRRTFSDAKGAFTLDNLTPGNYSVVARSPYAVGVIGVRVIEFENAAAGLNLLKQNSAPARIELPLNEQDATGGTIEPQSSHLAEHYTTPVSLFLQPEGAPNLSLDMCLATPFELPIPPTPEEEELPVPFAGGGGGGAGGGGGFFFPPFGWSNSGDDTFVSPTVPANPPVNPPPLEEVEEQ